MAKRIGIYAGTFDPVHAGHLGFALQALAAAKLDKIYFLPERQPRGKRRVEHFGHRVSMLKQATAPYPRFGLLELDDAKFSVARTWPRLKQHFASQQLVFLFGSDILAGLQDWPNVSRLLADAELVIGLRHNDDRGSLHRLVEAWPAQPKALTMFTSYSPGVSSGRVRQALAKGQPAEGLLTSVERYSNRHWLYISLS